MDRRSWPWKRKSSDKPPPCTDTTIMQLSNSGSGTLDEDDSKSVKYVQVTVESYARLTELEDEVKFLNENVKVLNEKLSSVQAEITIKENLVKQHAKVAEEAVSGWEKAEAEASSLKNQLESVRLMKLTAEEKVSHLDAALKECMKQIRNIKEESEQKLHDVVFAKTKHWEKVQLELESKIGEFEQELLRASAENAAVKMCLQERTNALTKISIEKSQAEADIEVLKANIQAYEKEISTLKFELHVASKELEIRNEEKNMCVRSAEVASKQHVEDAKKITKLEAECQRLRGLVRKKLPGPAAIAQMKLEVESLGREYGEPKIRRSPAKNSSLHLLSTPDYGFERMQQIQKENEFLTARLMWMEKETKMLKEALAKKANELQYINLEGSVGHNESNISVTSMSEDGINDEESCPEFCATALISELSHFKKDKDNRKGNTVVHSNSMELMDDFLEMERLACLSAEANGNSIAPIRVNDKIVEENGDVSSVVDLGKDGNRASNLVPPIIVQSHSASNGSAAVSELQSRIASSFEFRAQNADLAKNLEDIRYKLEETQGETRQQPEVGSSLATHSMDIVCEQHKRSKDIGEIPDDRCSNHACGASVNCNHAIDGHLKSAFSQIHDFIVLLSKRALEDERNFEDKGLHKTVGDFSVTFNKLLNEENSLGQFVFELSQTLSTPTQLSCITNCNKDDEREGSALECVNKVTFLENKVVKHETLRLTSDLDVGGSINHGFELVQSKAIKFSLEDFEQLKLEKANVEVDLAKCTEMLEDTKFKLAETEKKLEGLELELTASQKSNRLAETQLKCMAESYKLLESRSKDLESEINLLHSKPEKLDNELQEERRSHQGDLAKYKDLEMHIKRTDKFLRCSTAAEDDEIKTKHEREIAAAAEELVKCQETILILGRQLQSLRPPADNVGSSPKHSTQLGDDIPVEANQSCFNSEEIITSTQADQMVMDSSFSLVTQRTGAESPFDGYNSTYMSPSEIESNPLTGSAISSKRQKHRSSSKSLSSPSSNSLTDKHRRGLSRFFSKGKSDQ